jgi:hypothetical protein
MEELVRAGLRRIPVLLQPVVVGLAVWALSNLAWDSLSTLPPSPVRDAGLVLIWLAAFGVFGWVVTSWLRSVDPVAFLTAQQQRDTAMTLVQEMKRDRDAAQKDRDSVKEAAQRERDNFTRATTRTKSYTDMELRRCEDKLVELQKRLDADR